MIKEFEFYEWPDGPKEFLTREGAKWYIKDL
jgi:hypothetical protein